MPSDDQLDLSENGSHQFFHKSRAVSGDNTRSVVSCAGDTVMILLSRLALLAAFSLGSTALAQTSTGTTTGSTGNSGPSGASSTPNTGFSGTQLEGAPTISGGGATGANVNSSNILAGYYANPLYAGRPGSTGTDGPGGFGTAMSGGSTSSGANRNSSIASRTTGSSGRATTGTGTTGTSTAGRTTTSTPSITGTQAGQGFGSGFGGTTGTGTNRNSGFGANSFGNTGTTGFGNTGFGNTGGRNMGGTTQQQGVVAQASRSVAYSVRSRIPNREITPAMMTSDLNIALARSTALSNPGSVNASYDGRTVVLRGQVKDADEAKLAESVIRLTPGVRVVQNELTFPKQ
jgi:hypothetical protein